MNPSFTLFGHQGICDTVTLSTTAIFLSFYWSMSYIVFLQEKTKPFLVAVFLQKPCEHALDL